MRPRATTLREWQSIYANDCKSVKGDTREMAVYIIHIGKTGGSSFKEWIYQNIKDPNDIYVNHDVPKSVEQALKKNLSNGYHPKFILGHFSYGTHEFIKDPNPEYVTLLRDPIKRFISQYYHWIRHRKSGFTPNLQSLGCEKIEDFINHRCSYNIANLATRRILNRFNVKLGELDISLARERIDSFSEVGYIENIDDLLGRFSKRYGLTNKPIGMFNVHSSIANTVDKLDQSLLERVISQILDKCFYDIKLYEHVTGKEYKCDLLS
jgi:hypothetical protein